MKRARIVNPSLPGNFESLPYEVQLRIVKELSPTALIRLCNMTSRGAIDWCQVATQDIFPERIRAIAPNYRVQPGEDLREVYKRALNTLPVVFFQHTFGDAGSQTLLTKNVAGAKRWIETIPEHNIVPIHLNPSVNLIDTFWVVGAVSADETEADHPFVSFHHAVKWLYAEWLTDLFQMFNLFITEDWDFYSQLFTDQEIALRDAEDQEPWYTYIATLQTSFLSANQTPRQRQFWRAFAEMHDWELDDDQAFDQGFILTRLFAGGTNFASLGGLYETDNILRGQLEWYIWRIDMPRAVLSDEEFVQSVTQFFRRN